MHLDKIESCVAVRVCECVCTCVKLVSQAETEREAKCTSAYVLRNDFAREPLCGALTRGTSGHCVS